MPSLHDRKGMKGKPLTLLIPVREEEGIGQVLQGLLPYQDLLEEILLIYDDPGDPTLPLAEQARRDLGLPLRLLRNRGVGVREAICTGIAELSTPYLLVMMGDGHDDPATIPLLLEEAERSGAAIVGASRYQLPFQPATLKEKLSSWGNRWLTRLKRLPLTDLTNNYRLYRRDFLLNHPPCTREGFAVAMEWTIRALEENLGVSEVPTRAHPRQWGSSKFKLLRWLPSYLYWAGRLLMMRNSRSF